MTPQQSGKLPDMRARSGQALLEYALILVLVAVALAAALIATGPALGNVFSNVVCNLIEQQENCNPYKVSLESQGGAPAFWQTVTAVASDPPEGREFQTRLPPIPTNSPTPGPSPTPSPITPTPTPTFTPTLPPTATPTDHSFSAPFVDPINQPVWWRVDSSVYLGGDDWKGYYYAGTDLSGTPAGPFYNAQLGPDYRWNIAFDWGNGPPLPPQFGGFQSDNFSVRWTRQIFVDGDRSTPALDPMTIVVSIVSDDGVRFYVDKATNPTPIINAWNSRSVNDPPLTATIMLTGGPHELTLEYYDASGTAAVFLNMSQFRRNTPADTALPTGAPNCSFARITGSQPNTVAWAWEENPTGSFPPNMRCHLELRGSVDLTPLDDTTRQVEMNFWDVWDFGAATTASLQIAEYAPYNADGSGGPNWAAATTIALRNGGRNYNWTRNSVIIPSALRGKLITYRFILESAGGAGIRRYYVDDIKIDYALNPALTFTACSGSKDTCGYYWNLDDTAQKGDFITSGRWDLTSFRAVQDGPAPLAWDSSNDTDHQYVRFGPEQAETTGNFRIHFIEFSGLMSFPYNADGTGGTPDWQGDEGYPLLTFSHEVNLGTGDSVEIQWTRDARDTVPDNWTTLRVLATGAINQPMREEQVELQTIPNWNTQPFRLRFALRVDSNTNVSSGWFIDNILLERKGVDRFSQYPFCDDAENGSSKWRLNAQWQITNTTSRFGGTSSYTDSQPNINYLQQQSAMELRYPIDFNNDTPENLTNWGGNKSCQGPTSGAAQRPILRAWFTRALRANDNFHIDLFRLGHTPTGTTAIAPTPVWTYTYNFRTRDQLAWEMIELDLRAAIEQVTGQTWQTLTSNANPRDDDFFIQFRLDARSDPAAGDGVYIDEITIGEYSEVVHKLWDTSRNVTPLPGAPPAGPGNGPRFVDDIDTPTEWWTRWQVGGDWTGIDYRANSGIRSFHDSPPDAAPFTPYRHDTYSILEMNRIIDLRGATRADNPTLYFWNRYDTGDDDVIMVQIAIQDQYEMTGTPNPTTVPPRRNRQGYGYVYDWGSTTSYGNGTSWQTVWSRPEFSRVDTWIREQIDLRPYADDPATTSVNEGKRLKIRFVLDALDVETARRDGWYIDDIRVEFRQPRVIGLPFFDQAQNTANWIREGLWGLAPDYWKGSGGGPAALGPNTFDVYWIDCIRWMLTPSRLVPMATDYNQINCDTNNTNTFLNFIPQTKAATDQYFAQRPLWVSPTMRLTDNVSAILNEFGTTGRPFGAPPDATGATWTDNFMGRWIRDISVLAGDYTFITTSDDGVRVRYETQPAGGAPAGWNIINNWTFHGRTVNMSTVNLLAGDYTLVVEYFESTGQAVMNMQVGNNSFSFSDSPRGCANDTCPVVPSVPFGNSSLILNGVLNLNVPTGLNPSLWRPRLQYYTYYDLATANTARVEVTIDGGFAWTQNNLNQNCPSGVPSGQCDPSIWGAANWLPIPVGGNPGREWQFRSHDLRSYANQNIGLRFRLQTGSQTADGWWITEILVNN